MTLLAPKQILFDYKLTWVQRTSQDFPLLAPAIFGSNSTAGPSKLQAHCLTLVCKQIAVIVVCTNQFLVLKSLV
jgi:hypothetical protein